MRKLSWSAEGQGRDAVWTGSKDGRVLARLRWQDVPHAGWVAYMVAGGLEVATDGVWATVEGAQRKAAAWSPSLERR